MLYVCLDIHDKRIAICVLGETGQIVRRAQVRTIDEMMRILEALPDRFEVCYEASCGYDHYHDTLSPIAPAGDDPVGQRSAVPARFKVSSMRMVIESVTATALHQIEETDVMVIGFWTGISVAPSAVEAAGILPRSSPSAGRSGSESDGAAWHPRRRTGGGWP
jgi:hypothetical protein